MSIERIEIGAAVLYCGDAYEVLETINPLEYDLLLTDPMYGMGANAKGATARRGMGKVFGGTRVDNKDWEIDDDTQPFDPTPFLGFRKIILWGGNHCADKLPSQPKWLVWDKRDGVASDDNSDCELAWTNLQGKAIRIHRQLWKGVCRAGEENLSRGGEKLHPYQKPVALGRFCIAEAKLQADSHIIDFFCGSGSFGVAALELGHRVTLVEKERHFFDIACKRIEQAQKQQRLFA